MIIGYFEDEQWPMNKANNIRYSVRGFIENREGKFAVLRMAGKDEFGERNHLETPGGKIEVFETYRNALKRKMKDELGCEISGIVEIGEIRDSYNLLNRVNRVTFFYGKIVSECNIAPVLEEEKELFKGVEWYSLEELEKMLDPTGKEGVELLVNRRDYCALKHLKQMKSEKAC